MTKIRTLKPTLATMAPRIGRMPADEKGRDKQRYGEQQWREWYGSRRWKRLRDEVKLRDLYTCQMPDCGRLCSMPGQAIADHKTPHHGNPELFWDASNIWCICKACHDSVKQREERAARLKR